MLGVVSAPALGRRWWATRGGGAFANGEPIHVSEVAVARRRAAVLRRRAARTSVFGCGPGVRRADPRGLGPARLRRLLGPHARGRGDRRRDGRAGARHLGRRRARSRSSRRPAAASPTGGARAAPTAATRSPPTAVLHDEVLEIVAGARRRRDARPVTVGIDIGTSSVKAIAADDDGNVVARRASRTSSACRRPGASSTTPTSRGARARAPRSPRSKPRSTATGARRERRGDGAVAHRGRRDGEPLLPGLLYGDERGRAPRMRRAAGNPGRERRAAQLRALDGRSEAPDAAGLWPAQAVANHALCGEAVLDTRPRRPRSRCSTSPAGTQTLVDRGRRARRAVPAARADRMGVRPIAFDGEGGDGPALASGCIDAFAEQLVAGADHDGDVLVILGTTLIVWAVTTERDAGPRVLDDPAHGGREAARRRPEQRGRAVLQLGDAPARRPGRRRDRARVACRCGRRTRAASARRCTTRTAAACSPTSTSPTTPPRVRRAAYEASGFVTRRVLDAAREHTGRRAAPDRRDRRRHRGRRVGAGRGRRDRAAGRLRARARGRRARLGVAGAHRGRARGADGDDRGPAVGRRRPHGRTRPAWVEPVAERYERFLALSPITLSVGGSGLS